MEGPRATRPEEFDHFIDQANLIFRPDHEQDIATDYPHVFNRRNLANMRVILDNGKIVCYVGIAPRDIITHGCRLPAGLISVMGTLPEYRHRGLATRLVQDCLAKMHCDGFDFGLLWTSVPDFYRHTGWEVIDTNGWTCLVTPDEAGTFECRHTVRRYNAATDLAAMIALHEAIPERIVRGRALYELLYSLPKHHVWVAEDSNGIAGYASDAHACNKVGIVEWAGSSAALESLIAHIAPDSPGGRLQVFVPQWRNEMAALLEAKGCRQRVPMEEGDGAGIKMVRIVRLRQLLERLVPYIERRLPDMSAQFGIVIRETGERVSIQIDNGRVSVADEPTSVDLELTLRQTVSLIFGPDKPSAAIAPAPGIAEILDRLFPFSFHIWMLDYV